MKYHVLAYEITLFEKCLILCVIFKIGKQYTEFIIKLLRTRFVEVFVIFHIVWK